MAPGRVPGPNLSGSANMVLQPGPICDLDVLMAAQPGTPLEADCSGKLFTQQELDDGEAELALFRAHFGAPLNKSGKQRYAHKEKREWKYHTEQYLLDRARFFGGTAEYTSYLDIAAQELKGDEKISGLENLVEPPLKHRKKTGDWKPAQRVFYAWVRKAYENALKAEGRADVSISDLIRAGKSERLVTALAGVAHDYGGLPNHGGFNPRPMKMSGGYRLGTLSDHALGMAVDIDPAHNPQIEVPQWQAILAYTGEQLSQQDRKRMWKNEPERLHAAVLRISEKFSRQVQQALDATELPHVEALQAVIKADANLQRLGAKLVEAWRGGFLALPWLLVKAMHEHGFTWGATFRTPDLHHFEL